jgi:hypothetical protein
MGSATDSPPAPSDYIGSMSSFLGTSNPPTQEQLANRKDLSMDVPPLVTNSSPYAIALMWAFMFTNAMRVFTYLPTILKLTKPNVTGDCQSTLTWLLWTLSNATLTLQLFEVNQRRISDVILFSALNTVMCLICLVLVYRVQARARMRIAAASSSLQQPSRTQPSQLNRFSNQ